jgi:nucleoside-diphosphate-sugar epimerase
MVSEGDPNTEESLRRARKTVIVTGSSGLIGSPLCVKLAETYNVVGFDRPGAPHPPPQADRIDVDMASNESVENALETVRRRYGNQITSVIHLAAYYDFSGKPSPNYDLITVQGTDRLLRFLSGFDVEQFIFCSTMLVHAPSPVIGKKINENSQLAPAWDYPKSKARTEELIRRRRHGIRSVMVRLAGVYNDQCHSIPLANQIQRIYERTLTSHLFPGDMRHGQSFIHLDDTVELFTMLVAKREKLPPEFPVLAGEPVTLSYAQLQNEFATRLFGKPWLTLRIPKIVAKFGAWVQNAIPLFGKPFIKPWMIDLADDHYELNIFEAKRQVGWTPHRTLSETIPAMIAALKKNPSVWYRENKLSGETKDDATAATKQHAEAVSVK